MKTIFIETKDTIGKITFTTRKLPKTLGLVTTIQYLAELKDIQEFLKKKNISSIIAGQVLGCNAKVAKDIVEKVEAFLFFGSGEFHPVAVAIETQKPTFKLHPQTMKITEIDQKQIDKIEKKKRGMFAKFLTSNVIGILTSTKSGQSTVQAKPNQINELKKKYPDKQFYTFLADTLDYNQLDNFNFIECWINTMCPRIMEDIKVLNIRDINF